MSESESSEDETEVYIQFGEHTETFSLSDANNAQKVKETFSLDHEPACLFEGKKKKRVNLGNLKNGKTYKFEDTDNIKNQKIHTQNAVVISKAVYKDDPTQYLTDSSPNHTISSVCAVSQNSAQGVMLAVGMVATANTLYVAFRGTASWDDAVADADIHPD